MNKMIELPKLESRTLDAYIVHSMGGGLCKIHGKYYGYGKHGLRACPFCDIDEYFKWMKKKKAKRT